MFIFTSKWNWTCSPNAPFKFLTRPIYKNREKNHKSLLLITWTLKTRELVEKCFYLVIGLLVWCRTLINYRGTVALKSGSKSYKYEEVGWKHCEYYKLIYKEWKKNKKTTEWGCFWNSFCNICRANKRQNANKAVWSFSTSTFISHTLSF